MIGQFVGALLGPTTPGDRPITQDASATLLRSAIRDKKLLSGPTCVG